MSRAEKPNLDLMRSFAVLAVLFDHTWLSAFGTAHSYQLVTSIGFFGVCLFFVHTTLVLMWSMERQPRALGFYVRRAFRIYPLAMLFVVSIVVLNLLPEAAVYWHFRLPVNHGGGRY